MANRTTTAAENREMKQAMDELKKTTRTDYEKLASHFYKTRLDGQPPSPKRVRDALRSAAVDWRPDYWRRMRNALMYDQVAAGYYDNAASIKATHNPVTKPKTAADRQMRETVGGKPGVRQKRVKKLSEADYSTLCKAIVANKDRELLVAVAVTQATGARPAEILGIRCLDDGIIFIPGAKQGADGKRGLDRHLSVSAQTWGNVKTSVALLGKANPGKAGVMHKLQSRMQTLTARLWPRRKAHPSLYTFRYALGSELKSSGLSRREIAYVMGHQATASADRYGDRRSGSGKTPIKAAPGADMSSIRETHTEPFSQSQDFDEGPRLG
jgi:integrase